MQDLRERLYKTKLMLLAVVLVAVGLATLFLARHIDLGGDPGWLRNWPLTELGSTLFITGLVVIALDYLDGRDREARDTERLRRVLRSETATMRDAVIEGFAFDGADLARVAAPETLDLLIRNSLALRLGDETFASEVYEEVRDQAIRATERWHNAKISIHLSMDRSARHASTPSYVVTARWEYTVVPTQQGRRFVSTSDRDESLELKRDPTSGFVWHIRQREGVDAGSREVFELVQFTIDGKDRPIRRTSRKGGQTYTVDLGADVVRRGKPVTLGYTIRTVVARDGHLLYIDLEQPTKGLSVQLDYGDTDITYANVLDFIASSQAARIVRTPASVPDKTVAVEFDGWAFPRNGVAFVWGTSDVASSQVQARTSS